MSRIRFFFLSHGWFLLFFGALYLAFLHPLFGVSRGFIAGDYGLQFYPWTSVYASALKQHQLPLWTPLIQSGFPLFAEGQTGMLYPLNVLLFEFLPFRAAYNGMFLLHFALGGLFSYLYARKMRMSGQAASLVAVVFTFGSAYAGCFYNIATLRSLVWFPLSLYFLEDFFEKRGLRPLFMLSLAMAQSWLAGFPQVAAYSCFFIALYFLLRIREESGRTAWEKIKTSLLFSAAVLIAVLTALPQLWATWDLAAHSTRALQDPSFVFWGSVAPWSLITLFLYPMSIFFRSVLYIGCLPLFFVLCVPAGKESRGFWVLVLVSVLLAFGIFNPLYWLLIKLPAVSLLRNPAKFLFFSAFFLSVIAGFSYDKFFATAHPSAEFFARFMRRGRFWIAVFFIMAAVVAALAQWGSSLLLRFGEWYVRVFVVGKSFHRGTPEQYLEKLKPILTTVQREASLSNFFYWAPFLFAIALLVGLSLWMRRSLSRALFQFFFFVALLLDLFMFGAFGYGSGFIGNVKSFPEVSALAGLPKEGKWLDATLEPQAVFPPNRNMLTGHSHAGAYAPFLDVRYYRLVGGFGVLDDSFGRAATEASALGSSRPLLDFLGIRYLILDPSSRPGDIFNKLSTKEGITVYENNSSREEWTLVPRTLRFADEKDEISFLKGDRFRPGEIATCDDNTALVSSTGEPFRSLRVLSNEPTHSVLLVESAQPCVLVRNQIYNDGWKVSIDGKRAPLRRVDLAFQGLSLPKGGHRVEFMYEPKAFIVGRWFYLCGMMFMLAGTLWSADEP